MFIYFEKYNHSAKYMCFDELSFLELSMYLMITPKIRTFQYPQEPGVFLLP